jgi:hypothetical protein
MTNPNVPKSGIWSKAFGGDGFLRFPVEPEAAAELSLHNDLNTFSYVL